MKKIETLTHEEYIILKNVPKDYKYLVRHDSGHNLWLFVNKPTHEGFCVWIDREELDEAPFDLFNHLFQFVKWKDEPYEIEELIKNYEKKVLTN